MDFDSVRGYTVLAVDEIVEYDASDQNGHRVGQTDCCGTRSAEVRDQPLAHDGKTVGKGCVCHATRIWQFTNHCLGGTLGVGQDEVKVTIVFVPITE